MSTSIIQTHLDPLHQQQSVKDIVPLDQSQDVLRPLVHSGFLSLKDIGCLLICTSKSITECLYNDDSDDLWRFLLKQRCSFEEEALLASKMSAKKIFLSTFQKKSERPPMQIRDLRYSPQDYLIIVNASYEGGDGRSIFSRVISGQDIPGFFQRGCFSLEELQVDIDLDDLLDVSLKIHIHRIADNRVMNFFESDDIDDNGDCINLYSHEALEMADLEYSRHLANELMGGQGYDIDTYAGLGYMDVDLGYEVCEESCESAGDGTCGKLLYIGLEVRIVVNDFEEIVDFPIDEAVTFAHFLENMYAWEK